MKKRYVAPLVVCLVCTAALISLWAIRGRNEVASSANSAQASSPGQAVGELSEIVRAKEGSTDGDTAPVADSREALRQELIAAESFFPTYARLVALPPDGLNPHESFFLAYILETCKRASNVDGAPQVLPPTGGSLESRPTLIEAARDRLRVRNVAHLCEGITVDSETDELISSLYRQAADGGDLSARAWVVQQDIVSRGGEVSVGEGQPIPVPGTPTEAEVHDLLAALSSRDPMAVSYAGRVLSQGFSDFGVAFGPNRITPSMQLQQVMWDLAACQFGANCGHDRLELAAACAYHSRCGTPNYATYLQRYVLTQQDVNDFAQIYPYIVAGMRRGDWSGVSFLRENPGGYIGMSPVLWGLGG